MASFSRYLTADEETQIHQQFQGGVWRCNNQVLWSGILRDEAQRWADANDMQTLTTVMGPLMDPSHSLCVRNQKSKHAWSKYLKGASAMFAWYISRGERVTVLSPPPPERFHPSGETSYQAIEKPILKGKFGTSAIARIEMVHPKVKGAEDIHYQIWPVDETTSWTAKFGESNVERRWRRVKTPKTQSNGLRGSEITEATKQHDVEHGFSPPHQEAKNKPETKKKETMKERRKARRGRKTAKGEEKRQEEKAKETKKETSKEKKKAKRERKKVKNEAKKETKKEIRKEKKKAKRERKTAKGEEKRQEEEKAKKEMKKTNKENKKAKRERKKAKRERRKAKKERRKAKKEAEKDRKQGRPAAIS